MAVYVSCDHCAAALEIDDEYAGWRVRCPQCSAVFLARPSAVLAGGNEAGSPWPSTPSPSPRPPAAVDSPPPALSMGAPAADPFAPTTPIRVAPTPPVPPPAPPVAPPAAGTDGLFAPPVPAAPNAPTHQLAKTAVFLGILSIACFHWLAGIPAIICAVKARREIRASNGALAGDHLALAGLILGIVGTILTVIGDSRRAGFSFPIGHDFNVNLRK